MTDKEFENKIGKSLKNYEEQPQHDIFSRIESTLAAQGAASRPPRKAVLAPLYRYVSAAAVIVLIMAGALYLNRRSAAEIVTEQFAESSPEENYNTVTTEIPHDTESDATATVENPTLPAASQTQPESATTQPLNEPVQTGLWEGSESGDRAATGTDTPEESAEPEQPKIYRPKRGQQPSRYEKRLIAQDTRRTSRQTSARRQGITGSIFGGNFGAGTGDLSTMEQDKVASANMLIKQTFDEAVPCANGLNTEDGFIMPVAESLNTQEAVLNHRMPITLGVSVAFPLNDRLSLTTGLSYSYLYSSSSQSFTSSSSTVTRELHYLGIPLGLTYTFYRTGNFNLYSQGSAMVEKALAWHETYGISTALDHNSESANYHVKGVQISANIAAGVSYSFNPNLALYIEPGVSYYFAQRHQPASYRTVHPVNFSLRVGLRFGK